MEQAYARALLSIVRSGRSPHEAVAAMKKNLEARGRSALLPKIARAFARLAEKERARSTIVLSVAREKDAKAALKAAEQVLAEQKVAEADLCEIVDESLIGGWRLEGRGLLVDRSWKKSLLSIYNAATK